MKKTLHIFAIISALLSKNPIRAMDPALLQEPTHELAVALMPQYATDLISFVKKIFFMGKECLIVCNRHGMSELFGVGDGYKSLKQFMWRTSGHKYVSTLRNVFVHRDQLGQELLIGFDDYFDQELYIYDINKDKAFGVKIKHKFSLSQKNDNTLVMINRTNNVAYQIGLDWNWVEHLKDHRPVVLRSVEPIEFLEDDKRAEGIVGHHMMRDQLSSAMFDADSLSRQIQEYISTIEYVGLEKKFVDCMCFHQTLDGTIILGHDHGKVSIWRPKETLLASSSQKNKQIECHLYALEQEFVFPYYMYGLQENLITPDREQQILQQLRENIKKTGWS